MNHNNMPSQSLKEELRKQLRFLLAEKLRIERYLIDLESRIQAVQDEIVETSKY